MPSYKRLRHEFQKALGKYATALVYTTVVAGGLAVFLLALGAFSGEDRRRAEGRDPRSGVEIAVER